MLSECHDFHHFSVEKVEIPSARLKEKKTYISDRSVAVASINSFSVHFTFRVSVLTAEVRLDKIDVFQLRYSGSGESQMIGRNFY